MDLGSSNHTGVEKKAEAALVPKAGQAALQRAAVERKEAGRPRGVSIACTELVTVTV